MLLTLSATLNFFVVKCSVLQKKYFPLFLHQWPIKTMENSLEIVYM